MERTDHPLTSWLAANNRRAAGFSKDIGVSAVAISRYLYGTRIPRPAIALRIAELTGGAVPVETWVNWHPSVRSGDSATESADQALLETGQVAHRASGDGGPTVDPGIQGKPAQIGQGVTGGADGAENLAIDVGLAHGVVSDFCVSDGAIIADDCEVKP